MARRFGDDSLGGAQRAPGWIAALGHGTPPSPPEALGRNLSLQSWDVVKPPTAQDFLSFTAAALILPAGVGSTVSTTAATGGFFQLPDQSIGVLQTVVFSIVAPAVVDSFRFTIFENGSPIPGLANAGFQPVVASYFALPLKSIWQLSKGAQLSCTFVNVGGTGPLSVGLTLSGYHVTAADVFDYTGQRKGMLNSVNPSYDNLAR